MNYSGKLPSYNDIFGLPNTGNAKPNPARFDTLTGKPLNKAAAPVKNIQGKRPVTDIRNEKNITKDLENHFEGHEAECDTCDYLKMFEDLDRQHFKEMFVFSEVIGKPKALRKNKKLF